MALTTEQIKQAAKSAGWKAPLTQQDIANAQKYGVGIFAATLKKDPGAAARSAARQAGWKRDLNQQDIDNFNKYGPDIFKNTLAKNPQAGDIPTTGGGGGGGTTNTDLPKELTDNPYFNRLSDDSKELLAYNWKLQQEQNDQKKKAFQDALAEAAQQADPYWREQANIAIDEVNRTIAGYQSDITSEEEKATISSQRIQADLESESAFLDAEKQAALATQAQNYEVEAEQLRDQMAAQGISSSTISLRAKQRKAMANQGVVEGVTRRSAREKRIVETTATRGLEDVAANLLNLRRTKTDLIVGAARGAEAKLGSEALKGTSSEEYLTGGITGALADLKAADILTRANALSQSRGF